MHSLRQPLSPLVTGNGLPRDVLEDILWLAVTMFDNYSPSQFYLRYQKLTDFRLVCHSWDHIILSMSRLWTRVAVDASSESSRFPPPELVSTWLQRTSMPLHILIAMPEDKDPIRAAHIQTIFDTLLPHMNRWREFWFHSDAGVEGFPGDLSSAHNLTKLSITAGILDEDATDRLGQSFTMFPGILRELSLSTATFDCANLSEDYDLGFEGLQKLSLNYLGWMEGIHSILTSAQENLISASVLADGQWSDEPIYRNFGEETSMISLTRLQYLQIEIYDANLDLFRFLETEALRVLKVSVTWGQLEETDRDTTPLVDFIEDLNSLQTCIIRLDHYPSDWATRFFRVHRLSQIQTYKICDVEVDDADHARNIIATSASVSVRDRVKVYQDDTYPGSFAVGWEDHQ